MLHTGSVTGSFSLETPLRIANLRREARGYYVPWFVHWPEGGEPDFRVIGSGKFVRAIKENLCWVCGQPRGRYAAFVIGPMCAVNRTSAEPPCHRDCAIYSARACPFLTRPKMRRNEKDLPPETINEDGSTKTMGGITIARNPGVALVWVTRGWRVLRVFNGHIIKFDDPEETRWYCEGRPATRDECLKSIDSGLPILMELAQAEGPGAVVELNRLRERALTYLPPALEAR
jgi:hypothetical protein